MQWLFLVTYNSKTNLITIFPCQHASQTLG